MANEVREYFEQIRNIPLLSKEQEFELAKRARDGDKDAEAALISANLRLAVSEAKIYRGMGVPFADLIQEANVGLILAARSFDPDRGYRFSTYAVWKIKHVLNHSFANLRYAIRVPEYVQEDAAAIARCANSYRQQYGEEPEEALLLEKTGVSDARMQNIKKAEAMQPFSFNATVGEGTEIAEFIPDPNEMEKKIEDIGRKMDIEQIFRALREREKLVLKMYYGLGEEAEPASFSEIGKKLGVSKERVRQIEMRAMEKLRKIVSRD